MPIEPHRIEAAARARYEHTYTLSWDDASPLTRASHIRDTSEIAATLFPELAAGTAWVAPWEATEEMEAAEREAGLWAIKHAYPRARDAHLSKGKDDDHG